MDAKGKQSWADLPADIVISIADRLTFSDFIRFRAICKSWKLAVKDMNSVSSRQIGFPWIALYSPNRYHYDGEPWLPLSSSTPDISSQLSFFNPSENRFYRFPAPSYISFPIEIHCYKDGWIVSYHRNLRIPILFNPVTGAQLHLPSFSTHPAASGGYDNKKPSRVVLAADAAMNKVAFASYATSNSDSLAFAMPGGDVWSHIHTFVWEENNNHDNDNDNDNDEEEQGVFMRDVVFHDSKFYALYSNGQLLVFGISTSTATTTAAATQIAILAKNASLPHPLVQRGDMHLLSSAPSPSGELLQLQITSAHQTPSDDWASMSFLILKFDHRTDGWVEVKEELHDQSVFFNRYRYGGGMVFSALDVEGLRRNCIYFTDHLINYYEPYMKNPRSELTEGYVFDAGVYEREKAMVDPCFSWNEVLSAKATADPSSSWIKVLSSYHTLSSSLFPNWFTPSLY